MALDSHDGKSDSGALKVILLRSKATSYPLFIKFIQRFPNAFSILRNLLTI